MHFFWQQDCTVFYVFLLKVEVTFVFVLWHFFYNRGVKHILNRPFVEIVKHACLGYCKFGLRRHTIYSIWTSDFPVPIWQWTLMQARVWMGTKYSQIRIGVHVALLYIWSSLRIIFVIWNIALLQLSSSAMSLVKPANHSRGKFLSAGNLRCQTVVKCVKFKDIW